jgi:hypothetical protein
MALILTQKISKERHIGTNYLNILNGLKVFTIRENKIMIRLTDIISELKEKKPLINLFKDTDIIADKKIKNLLIHYVESQHNLQDGDFYELVSGLMKLKSKYPELLKPKTGYAYRGTSITPAMYKKIKNNPTKKEGGITIIQAPYTSAREAQSWTYDSKVANSFASKGLFNNPRLEMGGKPAVIRVKIDDTFVGNPNLTKPISNRLSIKNEKEIFHLGKSITNAEWLINSADIELGKFK